MQNRFWNRCEKNVPHACGAQFNLHILMYVMERISVHDTHIYKRRISLTRVYPCGGVFNNFGQQNVLTQTGS